MRKMALFSSYSWNWAVSAGPFSLGTKGAETCGSHYQLNAREKRGVRSVVRLKPKLNWKADGRCIYRSAAGAHAKGSPHLSLIHGYPLGCGEPLMIFDVVHSIPQVAVPLGQVHLDWVYKSGQGEGEKEENFTCNKFRNRSFRSEEKCEGKRTCEKRP